MAVTHLVCVFEGAPGPVQGAATAMPAVASDTTPNSAGASAPERYASKFDCVDMHSSLKVLTLGFPFLLPIPSETRTLYHNAQLGQSRSRDFVAPSMRML